MFEPTKSFFQLKVVRITICCVVFLALVTIGSITYNLIHDGFELDPTFIGFNNLLTYYKAPLGTLTLLIPLLAVYAANHRSEQSKSLILATQEQNKFNNYYKHKEEFSKFVKEIESAETYDCNKLHRKLFGAHKNWDMSINITFEKHINTVFFNLVQSVNLIRSAGSSEEIYEQIIHCTEQVSGLFQTYYFQVVYKGKVKFNDKKRDMFDTDVYSFVREFEKFVLTITPILAFDNDYERPLVIRKVVSLDKPISKQLPLISLFKEPTHGLPSSDINIRNTISDEEMSRLHRWKIDLREMINMSKDEFNNLLSKAE